jgi:hypothetical protein
LEYARATVPVQNLAVHVRGTLNYLIKRHKTEHMFVSISENVHAFRGVRVWPLVSGSLLRDRFSQINGCLSGITIVEVRGFEPRTPCMPSTKAQFSIVHSCPILLNSALLEFIKVHESSLVFISTAEVSAEVSG